MTPDNEAIEKEQDGEIKSESDIKSAIKLRLQAFFEMNNTRIYTNKRVGFLMAGGAAILLAGYTLPKSDTAEPTKLATKSAESLIDLTRHDLYLETTDSSAVDIKTLKVKSGDSLGPLLQKNGLTGQEAYKVTEAFSTVYKPRNVRVGQEFGLHFTNGTLDHLTFKPSVEKTVFVDRVGESYAAREIAAEFKYETLSVASQISNSLYVDATRLGAPDKVVAQFANIYEYSVDFQRDIQPGDEFELFFEVARDHKGEIIRRAICFTPALARAARKLIITFIKTPKTVRISMMPKARLRNVSFARRPSMARGCPPVLAAASIRF